MQATRQASTERACCTTNVFQIEHFLLLFFLHEAAAVSSNGNWIQIRQRVWLAWAALSMVIFDAELRGKVRWSKLICGCTDCQPKYKLSEKLHRRGQIKCLLKMARKASKKKICFSVPFLPGYNSTLANEVVPSVFVSVGDLFYRGKFCFEAFTLWTLH